MAGRFAVSLTVLVPVIALGARATDVGRTSLVIRYGIPAFLVLMVLSGVSGGAPLWFSRSRGMTTDDVPGLVRFLREHDLRHGYGEYWGAHANAVTVVSRGEITMRPVAFDPRTGHVSRRGDSSLWYGPDGVSGVEGKSFVAFTDDGENCRSMKICESGLRQQFGLSEARYLVGPITILVWPKPIVVR